MRLVVFSASDGTPRGGMDECHMLNTEALEIGRHSFSQRDDGSAVEAVSGKPFQSLGVDFQRRWRVAVAEEIDIELLRRIEADGAEGFVERLCRQTAVGPGDAHCHGARRAPLTDEQDGASRGPRDAPRRWAFTSAPRNRQVPTHDRVVVD